MAYIDDLLDPAPLRLETGLSRLESGALVVAVRTDLHGCKGRMLDWWFKQFDTDQHLNWWHPLDHVAHHGWDQHWRKGKSYVGATIRAVEALGDIPPVPAIIKFHQPTEIFAEEAYRQAIANQDVSTVVYARIGFGAAVALDANGDPTDGQMVHVVRDTSYGAVLRSRFILGQNAGATGHPLPDAIGFGLLQHCHTEFRYLSKLLPSLYWGDQANRDEVPLLW
ncbi:DAPG hydrolase family protein [Phaeospirillum tilakii]|uniref:DAPG hydrolase family protein n=1 Tax=Phaeospirillum tilakii TaxID=741673 RepID=A0ABW5C8F0_9PROT